MLFESTEFVGRSCVPFVADLSRYGDRTALIADGAEISYGTLAERVDSAVRQLGTTRRLVLITGANTVDVIVAYLACLSAGHPVLLVPGGSSASLASMIDLYRPDVVCEDGRFGELTEGTAHDLHRDLALLLTTSGSTGSPKLVRLSHENVQANAESIATYLGIRESDRAITTLPMHYCYGLSILHSHLLRGAGTVLTDRSVTDSEFWALMRKHRVSALSGVPYTFDLLDRVGFADMDLPSLRYVTQAGGRLGADRVRGYSELGRRRGWDFFVMYGQTEATARMAYLPPALTIEHPDCIGIAVPGGSFRIEPIPESENGGELVYSGPNVMLGYATEPQDLALGREIDELRTGDLAVRNDDGLYRIVGRRSRFAKLFGLRIDLQRVEAALIGAGFDGCCTGGADELLVAVTGTDEARATETAAQACGLPTSAVRVRTVPELPRTQNGKVDYRAVAALFEERDRPDPVPPESDAQAGFTQLRDLYSAILGTTDVDADSTFVGLGGDSLSYVRMSVRLERLLGHLPPDWHTTPLRDLVPSARSAPRGWRTIETNVLIRALAIVLIVGSHANLFAIVGGAHVLLAAAGYNYARFVLPGARRERLRHTLQSVRRIAVPSMLWIGALVAFTGVHPIASVLLLNGFFGPEAWTREWRYWFIEALVYILIALAVLLAIPRVDSVERKHPFVFPLALVALGLLTRYQVIGPDTPTSQILASYVVFWLFPLGWAAARATTVWHRVAVSAVAVATLPGFFYAEPDRTALVIAGLLLLIWLPRMWWPALLVRPVEILAGASLYIYLTHFTVYTLLESDPWIAFTASIAGGIVYWYLWLGLEKLRRRISPGTAGTARCAAGARGGWRCVPLLRSSNELPPGSRRDP
ncbi:AMP-binding protein [Rhodococcus chondri]|uniref:AMP-binding protein n=1 Tax=Rhodococcus chondri TaxID=3065941 RepID=A0ABU7JRG9_9NOCA|nr:AMP-binding protein [Rhodococcus sp. CC-R104]MEE2032618.1 AMP-binding protein [Rhodococcus sp. CC-R104]